MNKIGSRNARYRLTFQSLKEHNKFASSLGGKKEYLSGQSDDRLFIIRSSSKEKSTLCPLENITMLLTM